MPAPIKVLKVTPRDWGTVKATADVMLGAIEVRGFKVIQQDGQSEWVAWPDEKGKDGNWYPRVLCHKDDLKYRIQDHILNAWHDHA